MLNPDRRLIRDRAAARLAMDLVAYATGISVAELDRETRGSADAAFARQAAMYLTHVAFSLSLSRVAIAFGRDRSTVAHACRRIEDSRDDEQIDELLNSLEAAIQAAPQPRPPALSGGVR